MAGRQSCLIIEARETSAFKPGFFPAGKRGGVKTPPRPSSTRAFRPGFIPRHYLGVKVTVPPVTGGEVKNRVLVSAIVDLNVQVETPKILDEQTP